MNFDPVLLSRVEDAGINAAAPPQQRWLDGWLVRFSPGKAKRARCINAVAAGRMPVADKLALAGQVYRDAGLPLFVRITPFSAPAHLDEQLERHGLVSIDDTRVMVCTELPAAESPGLPAGVRAEVVDHPTFAETVGALRGSPASQRRAQAERLTASPVPFRGQVLRDDRGDLLGCGQYAIEHDLVGLYDVFIAEAHRGRGLAAALCKRLLADASAQGARTAYLQVEGDNHAARSVYQRLGFADGYRYHYRAAPSSL